MIINHATVLQQRSKTLSFCVLYRCLRTIILMVYFFLKNRRKWSGQAAQQVKALVAIAAKLRLDSGSHSARRKLALTNCPMTSVHAHTYTHKTNKCKK